MAGRAAVKLVTFDVTNTCIRVLNSPGFHYAKVAAEFGVEAKEQALNKAFASSFKTLSSKLPNFGRESGIHCKIWWQELVQSTFTLAGVSENKSKLAKISERIYACFDGPDNWEVYPDVPPVLEELKQSGIKLGVVSNFDERLRNILSGLGLSKYFDFILASYEVQCAKPSPRIFELALERASVEANEAIHIGDNEQLDYFAAKAVGMRSFLILRDEKKKAENGVQTIRKLNDLLTRM